ncbi:MAG: hypothetical protein LBG08_00650 [Spirochaetaceae bacterium]|nr:hypothetical protein [Spirochaetaceae bacterium]
MGILLCAGLVWLLLAGCANPFDQRDVKQPDAAGSGMVTIRIGAAGGSARTVFPDSSGLAGYRLTFSPSRDAVDITGGKDCASFILTDGTWTITGSAYTGGSIEGGTLVATGSITITLRGGVAVDSEGAPISIPPIILKPITGGGWEAAPYPTLLPVMYPQAVP